MISTKPQFITDDKGRKLSVVLSIKDYDKLIEELEDRGEDVRIYDEAKKSKMSFTDAEIVYRRIEEKHKKQYV